MSVHRMKRIAVLGEIGSGNLGDDWGYVLLSDELRAAFDEMDILVDIRPLTPNLHGLLAGYHWDAVVTGVGTLLDQAEGTYVRALRDAAGKCPVAVVGTGISDSRHYRPTPDGRMALLDLLLRKCRHVWLRAPTVWLDDDMAAPDPVWLYGWHGSSEGRPLVGINVGYAGFSTMDLDAAYLAHLRIARSQYEGRSALFAAWDADRPWLERVRFPGEEVYVVTGTREGMGPLNSCRVVLCTRIHLGVLAACRGARPVLPEYAGKVHDVFHGTTVTYDTISDDAGVSQILSALRLPAIDNQDACNAAQQACRARVRLAAQKIAEAW